MCGGLVVRRRNCGQQAESPTTATPHALAKGIGFTPFCGPDPPPATPCGLEVEQSDWEALRAFERRRLLKAVQR